MKAIQFTEYGGPEVLNQVNVDVPVPTGHDVLVEIHAVGVNYADTARREGEYVVPTPLPFIPGAEIAGIVTQVGEKVTRVKPGTRIVSLIESGGYSEYALANEFSVIPLPDQVDFHKAVSIPLQGLSAYHVLKTMGRLQPEETVLVHAAAGGVGLIAVQLAKIFGAGKVIATASSQDKLDLAASMGADVLINYTEEGWEDKVREATSGKGVDVALEMAGGQIFNKTLRCLATFGRLVVFGNASAQPSTLDPTHLMRRNQSVIGFFLPQIMKKPELLVPSIQELFTYVAEGRLQLVIGGVYPLEEAANVHTLLQSRQTKGKLVLQVK
ncbi:zinc-binding alcohol dehydrogenase family protein [Peribacillus sp. SCS-155]|uniref:quinone oxidoreductase family protein n=1 Tax=Peribacillus sedimenti TaxID=3115297 RepID=UPI003905AAC7